MVLALLIVVAAGSLTAGIITANLSLTWISLGVAAAAFLLLLGDVMARRRRAGPHATAGPDEADEPEREEPGHEGPGHEAATTGAEPVNDEPIRDAPADDTDDPEPITTREAAEPGTTRPTGDAATTRPAGESATAGPSGEAGTARPAEVAEVGRSESQMDSAESTESAVETSGSDANSAPGEARREETLAGEARSGRGKPVGEDDIVHVVPGRKRFHQPGCRLLGSRATEELTLGEAREEGFTACSSCSADLSLLTDASRSPAA